MPQTRTDRAVRARDKRRKQLLDAATRVFARKSYWLASITDIIQGAGVARGTFYLYFRSKQEIFAAIVDGFREEEMRLIRRPEQRERSAKGRGLRLQVRAAVLSWFEFYFRNLDAAQIVVRDANMIYPAAARKRENIRRAVRSAIADNIIRMQKAGRYHRRVSAEVAAHFLQGMFDQIAASYLPKAKRGDLELLADQFVDFEFNGMLSR
jgi:AcrR family transcriptional regulator